METFGYRHLLGTRQIHHLVGVYNNGSRKFVDVPDGALEEEIEFNIIQRFGRSMFVDGVLVYTGYLPIDRCREIERELNEK